MTEENKKGGRAKYRLTCRELEVLELTQQGMQNQEIADSLGISAGTARNYLSSIYRKLNVGSRVEAIKKSVELGLLSPIEPDIENEIDTIARKMEAVFHVGDIIKVGPWHGVVQDVFQSTNENGQIAKVDFVKNAVRARGTELIELGAAPGRIERGTLQGMQEEFEALIQRQRAYFERLVGAISLECVQEPPARQI